MPLSTLTFGSPWLEKVTSSRDNHGVDVAIFRVGRGTAFVPMTGFTEERKTGAKWSVESTQRLTRTKEE